MSIFTQVKLKKPKKSKFDLGHEKKLSLNMGELIPTLVQEVIPGDSFKVSTNNLVRMHPLIAPIMHRIDVFTHFFFVPNRLIWKEWDDFIMQQKGEIDSPLNVPLLQIGEDTQSSLNQTVKASTLPGTLLDYFGIPDLSNKTINEPIQINALPFKAYTLIYNEYYRDQDLENEIPIDTGSAFGSCVPSNPDSNLFLRSRSWKKDYFTSARPWAQKGHDVNLPIGFGKDEIKLVHSNSGTPTSGSLSSVSGNPRDGVNEPTHLEGTIDAPNVRELRNAIKLQEWLEKNARAGSRYIEGILAHFGVLSKDARHQRPEYLGGGRQPVQISEVQSTAQAPTYDGTGNVNGEVYQGNLSGQGTSMGSAGFKKSFTEHGWIIGITSILPKPAYMNGINRAFFHGLIDGRFDYAWPEFAQIGEQPIFNAELYADGSSNDLATFGYAPRYAEYKYNPDTVHGDFKGNLEHWHLSRKFENLPTLNKSFIQYQFDQSQQRVFPVQDATDKFYMQIYNDVKAIRPLPYFGDPSF
jgi:hypothetical protein